LSAKKVLNVLEARLRAFSTSGLVHEIFAQSRNKTGFGMSSMNLADIEKGRDFTRLFLFTLVIESSI